MSAPLIRDIATETSVAGLNGDDYVCVDGDTAGTRKILAQDIAGGGGGGSGNYYGQVNVSGQDPIIADADPDILTLAAGTGIGITTDAGTDTVTISVTDAELAALAGLTSAADKLPYFTGVGTAALADLTAAGRALLDDANAAAQRTTLGLAIGTDVQAYDSELTALATVTSAADKLPYFDGSNSATLADFTAYGRTLVGAADQSVLKPTEALIVPCSDESTALTTGTAKITFRTPYAFTLTAVRANVGTAPTGANLIVDINESGVSILSTKLSIDAGEETSTTAATPAVISDTSLADDAKMTIDIDQIGSTIAGAGLKVTLIGYRT